MTSINSEGIRPGDPERKEVEGRTSVTQQGPFMGFFLHFFFYRQLMCGHEVKTCCSSERKVASFTSYKRTSLWQSFIRLYLNRCARCFFYSVSFARFYVGMVDGSVVW